MKIYSMLLLGPCVVSGFVPTVSQPSMKQHHSKDWDSTSLQSTAPESNSESVPQAAMNHDIDIDAAPIDDSSSSNSNGFSIEPTSLIELAKETVLEKGTGTKDNGECLATNFVFRAAFVETSRDEFINALSTFSLEDAFEIEPNFFGWHVDPYQTNRVWFMSRQVATHSKGDFFGVQPDGKELTMPPQCHHIDFNEEGKVTEFGFYTADRAQGNTGGVGGAFGYFLGVGKPLPFPEGKPYKPSFRYRLATGLGGFFRRLAASKKGEQQH